eukprot:CAMPEP_0168451996 /NCGR_PEP_ID=MMETSP0228-20121227/48920_1 /TAXON_ID=133427 /ORGANISM="Protoceratium reticulatum, Strain CCCM 535 (=CCMP 1889)" /LENGTH=157 /DNA_ID=CAMNT_0008466623 /DNA_START=1041 /DNA_END=1513 /DNA_ORIENTATION=-
MPDQDSIQVSKPVEQLNDGGATAGPPANVATGSAARTNEPRGEPQRENEREAHHQAADDRVGPVVAKHWHHLKLACPLTNIFPCCFLPVCTSSATCVREHLRRLKVIAASSSTTQPPSQPTKASRTNLVICSTHSGHVVPPSAFTIQHRHVSEHYAG